MQEGYTSLPGAEKGTLIQRFVQYPGSRFTTAGEAWRQVRNQWIIPYGGSLLLIVALALGIFYWRQAVAIGGMPTNGGTARSSSASRRSSARRTGPTRAPSWRWPSPAS